MRLASFISANMEAIISRWAEFAATCLPAGEHMTALELRDHGQQILAAIVLDLGTSQTPEEQAAKAQGLAITPFFARETAAQVHAVLRAESGFDIEQLASEYRALRASVLSLWVNAESPGASDLQDMIRFNEAIDQALAESIGHFNAQVDRTRNLLFGMLSHDMRSPLLTIQVTAATLARLDAGDTVSNAARRLVTSGKRVQALLDDLTDFNHTNLGLGIPVERTQADLAALCDEELEQLRVVHPGSPLELSVASDCRGEWDGPRLQQLVCNLVVNAVKHGTADGAIHVAVAGTEADVTIEVRNAGPTIAPATLAQIFEPLSRGPELEGHSGLGLGLYIVREIAKAHDGTVEARSNGGETVFTVRLPKEAASARP